MTSEIKRIIIEGTPQEKRALYAFDSKTSDKDIYKKFRLFTRGNYPRFFKSKDAPFHKRMIMGYIDSYVGGSNFLNIGFRGSSKTTIKKLFDVFILLNDEDSRRNYIKVLSRDLKNAKQTATDIYNLIVELSPIYGNVFESQGNIKREETMGSFTMRNGRKYASGTVGQAQRGHVQDAYRPDWIWFDDIEDADSIRSSVITNQIILKIDEAIQGLAKGGCFIGTGNYISEYGAIQWLMDRKHIKTLITPIEVDGKPTWDFFTLSDIQKIKDDALDWFGDYLCDPSRSENKFFSHESIDIAMSEAKDPIRTSGDIKYWGKFVGNEHHRYAVGADTALGVGLDSNTLALFDFDTMELIATYANNLIAPDIFGEGILQSIGNEFGGCLMAIENNNTGITTIDAIKSDYPNLYRDLAPGRAVPNMGAPRPTRIGWNTNSATKPKMFMRFRKDWEDGLIKIYDINVLKEMKTYTDLDLQEKVSGLATRHFDLLTAVVIAWQMIDYSNPTQHTQVEINKIWQKRQRSAENRAR